MMAVAAAVPSALIADRRVIGRLADRLLEGSLELIFDRKKFMSPIVTQTRASRSDARLRGVLILVDRKDNAAG